jgi:hypothetical protein
VPPQFPFRTKTRKFHADKSEIYLHGLYENRTKPKLKFSVDSFDFLTEMSNNFHFSSDVRLVLALLSETELWTLILIIIILIDSPFKKSWTLP